MARISSDVSIFESSKTGKKFLIMRTLYIDDDDDCTELSTYFLQNKDILLIKSILKEKGINYKDFLVDENK